MGKFEKRLSGYLDRHYDAETGNITGSHLRAVLAMRYCRVCWWLRWHREQPSVCTLGHALHMALRNAFCRISM